MDFDSKKLTLRQAAEIYATKYAKSRKGFDSPEDVQRFVTSTISMFKDVADEPGSAVQLFIPDENDKTVLRKLFEGSPADDQPTKKAMQNLRLIGHNVLKAGLKSTDELYELMPDSAVRSDKNERIFGRIEPPKGESLVAINPDREIQKEFFAKLSAKAADPETRKATLAALFLLNTGVRPEIIENLRFDHYNAKKGALYIPGDIGGAKGRAINIPLNPLADAIIQEFMKERIDAGFADPDGPNLIFFKYSKKGNRPPVKLQTGDVTDVLRDIEVGNNTDFGLIYDEKTQRHYTSLTPPELAKNKSGSRLLRNFHATRGDRLFSIPAERLAYLEGRTLKSVRKNLQTGSLEVYQITFPFDVNEDDRAFASRFAAFTEDAAGDLGLDFNRVMNLEAASETRIFGDDPRYSSYFKTPIETPVVQASSPINPTGDAKDAAISPELLEKLKKNPRRLAAYLNMLEAKGIDVSSYRKSLAAAGILTFVSKGAKAAGAILPGPDPLELAAGVLDEQMSPEGQSAADIAVERGQKFAGDLLGVEPRRAESMSDIFTKETLAQTAGGIGGVLADALTLGTVSGTGPFSGERTGNISGRNLRAQNLRARQEAARSRANRRADEGFIPKP